MIDKVYFQWFFLMTGFQLKNFSFLPSLETHLDNMVNIFEEKAEDL